MNPSDFLSGTFTVLGGNDWQTETEILEGVFSTTGKRWSRHWVSTRMRELEREKSAEARIGTRMSRLRRSYSVLEWRIIKDE